MAGKEKVPIKRSDQFQEVDEELSRVMEELDMTIERVSAIFDSKSEEDLEELIAAKEDAVAEEEESGPTVEAPEEPTPGVSSEDTPASPEQATTESKEEPAESDAG